MNFEGKIWLIKNIFLLIFSFSKITLIKSVLQCLPSYISLHFSFSINKEILIFLNYIHTKRLHKKTSDKTKHKLFYFCGCR